MPLTSKYIGVVLWLAIILLIGCNDPPWEIDTAIDVTTKKDLITFSFSGNGYPIVFSVFAHTDSSPDVIWQLVPSDAKNLQQAYKLAPIMYGQIPPGWKQIVPQNGEPPLLQERRKYSVSSISNGANTKVTTFSIHKRQVTIVGEL